MHFIISNGKGIYQIDSSGCYQEQPLYACVGSGSPFVKTYIDDNVKEGMSATEAKELAVQAISYAIKYDGSSGGIIRLFNLGEDGTMEKEVRDYYSFAKK